MNDKHDFIGEVKEWNKCMTCKCYFTGIKGRMFCRVHAPTTIEDDQIAKPSKN